MSQTGSLAYLGDHLAIAGPSLTRSVPAAVIDEIYTCTMEDEIFHGDDVFHILIVGKEFILVGPFVTGALGAIDALTTAHPGIPTSPRSVRVIPYAFRQQGLLGLRPFPVPGLRVGPISDLKTLHLVARQDHPVRD